MENRACDHGDEVRHLPCSVGLSFRPLRLARRRRGVVVPSARMLRHGNRLVMDCIGGRCGQESSKEREGGGNSKRPRGYEILDALRTRNYEANVHRQGVRARLALIGVGDAEARYLLRPRILTNIPASGWGRQDLARRLTSNPRLGEIPSPIMDQYISVYSTEHDSLMAP